jgi:hypothetical protein
VAPQNDTDNYVTCPECKARVKAHRLKKHRRKQHDKKQANPQRPLLKDMTPAQRKRYLDSLDKPEREWSSDVMDRGMVSLGGGYGLGRSRKH